MAGEDRRMGPAEWGLLLTLAVLWGGSFLFGKVAVADLPPLTLVLARVGLAALALLAVVRLSGHRLPRSPRVWGSFAVMGALNNVVPFGLIFWAQTEIASGLASILNATTPLFTIVVAHLATRDERVSPNRLAGVLVGFAGAVVVIGPDALTGVGGHVLGQVAVLGAALSYAVAGVFGGRFRGLPAVVPAAGQLTGSTALVLPAALLIDRPWTLAPPSPATWGAVAALALLCTAVAYVIYFRILAAAGATNLLLVTFLIPVSALLLGAAVLGEHLDPRDGIGMLLIFAGLAAIDGRPLAAARRLFGPPPVATAAGQRDC
jgi:drug/metabolite transporter (DMT)-like permease